MYWIKYEIPKSNLDREEDFKNIEIFHPEKFIGRIAIEIGERDEDNSTSPVWITFYLSKGFDTCTKEELLGLLPDDVNSYSEFYEKKIKPWNSGATITDVILHLKRKPALDKINQVVNSILDFLAIYFPVIPGENLFLGKNLSSPVTNIPELKILIKCGKLFSYELITAPLIEKSTLKALPKKMEEFFNIESDFYYVTFRSIYQNEKLDIISKCIVFHSLLKDVLGIILNKEEANRIDVNNFIVKNSELTLTKKNKHSQYITKICWIRHQLAHVSKNNFELRIIVQQAEEHFTILSIVIAIEKSLNTDFLGNWFIIYFWQAMTN